MAEESILKVQVALTNTLNEVDQMYTRKLQRDMHICAARCCEQTNDSMEQVYKCVKNCSINYEKSQIYLQNEFDHFQGRVQRCVLQCADDAGDKLGVSPHSSSSELAKFKKIYNDCVISCANKYVIMVPEFMMRLKESLQKKAYQTLPINLVDGTK